MHSQDTQNSRIAAIAEIGRIVVLQKVGPDLIGMNRVCGTYRED